MSGRGKRRRRTTQGARALRALLAVTLGVGAVGLSGWWEQDGTTARGEGAATFSGREAVRRIGSSDDGLADFLPAAQAPPEWFSEEVCDARGKADLMANEDWSVASWTERGSGGEAMASLKAQLGSRGWTVVESGMEQAVTCVKEEGRCQWLWLSCTEVAGETSVVVQVAGAAS